MYSQGKEEEAILKIFGEFKGRFLDIGAFDGKTFSNTLRLVELGWEGVLIEPSFSAFKSLFELHCQNEKLSLINAAVGLERGLTKFYMTPDAVSTTIESNREKWEKDAKFTTMYVGSILPEDILHQFGGFNFVNIDTEGNSVDILKRLNISNMVPRGICVEYDDRESEVRSYLKPFGYKEAYFDGNNLIFQHA